MKKQEHLEEPAEHVLLAKSPFNYYVEKKKLYREKQRQTKQRELNTPGSGYVWKKKITVPKEFALETEHINHHSAHINNLFGSRENLPTVKSKENLRDSNLKTNMETQATEENKEVEKEEKEPKEENEENNEAEKMEELAEKVLY